MTSRQRLSLVIRYSAAALRHRPLATSLGLFAVGLAAFMLWVTGGTAAGVYSVQESIAERANLTEIVATARDLQDANLRFHAPRVHALAKLPEVIFAGDLVELQVQLRAGDSPLQDVTLRGADASEPCLRAFTEGEAPRGGTRGLVLSSSVLRELSDASGLHLRVGDEVHLEVARTRNALREVLRLAVPINGVLDSGRAATVFAPRIFVRRIDAWTSATILNFAEHKIDTVWPPVFRVADKGLSLLAQSFGPSSSPTPLVSFLGKLRSEQEIPSRAPRGVIYARSAEFVPKLAGELNRLGYKTDDQLEVQNSLARVAALLVAMVLLMAGGFVLAAVANILTTSAQELRQRIPEIGILQSFGTSRTTIALIFLAQGTLLGILGFILGFGAGCAAYEPFQSLLAKVFTLPTEARLGASEVLVALPWLAPAIFSITVTAALIGTAVPALLSTRLRPSEAFRHHI